MTKHAGCRSAISEVRTCGHKVFVVRSGDGALEWIALVVGMKSDGDELITVIVSVMVIGKTAGMGGEEGGLDNDVHGRWSVSRLTSTGMAAADLAERSIRR